MESFDARHQSWSAREQAVLAELEGRLPRLEHSQAPSLALDVRSLLDIVRGGDRDAVQATVRRIRSIREQLRRTHGTFPAAVDEVRQARENDFE